MAPNRHRRRAQAARARRAGALQGLAALSGRPDRPRGLVRRLLSGLAGAACVGIAVAVLITPHGAHTARGLFFLLIIGGALLVTAFLPG